MPTIYDNINERLTDALRTSLYVASRADFCVGYFNLRGWRHLSDMVDKWSGSQENCCRLLVGMHRSEKETIAKLYSAPSDDQPLDNKTANAMKVRLAQEFKDQLTLGYPTAADEAGLRTLSAQLKEGKLVIKLFLNYPLHAKLYLTFRQDFATPIIGFLGSSNLTLSGLKEQGELNIDVLEQDAAKKLSDWFNERWEDRYCVDISRELADIIDNSWAGERLMPPYHIYLKIAYHLSSEARAGLAEFTIPKAFRNKLLDFQSKAVLIAAHHLNKRGGVVIGDVVGLGKTITATALAKIFEDDLFLETLIICPKNLVEMWEGYVHEYQLRAKVLSISTVGKELDKLRRYRLVLIDESHNLRNVEGKRYRKIKEYIERNDSKVILLSATPYNKTYIDLFAQLSLFVDEETDLGIGPERYIESLGGGAEFGARHQAPIRSLKAFSFSNDPDDWRELMRLYLIRRTRSFIKANYAKVDEHGRKYLEFPDGDRQYFPDRIPKRVSYAFSQENTDDQYAFLYSESVVTKITHLNVPRYGLGLEKYRNAETPTQPTRDEQNILDNLSHSGRRLMGFCKTNLYKRLESSGHSFLLSLKRHLIRNYLFVYAFENGLPFPVGSLNVEVREDYLEDEDQEIEIPGSQSEEVTDKYSEQAKDLYAFLETHKYSSFDWISSRFFNKTLVKELKEDIAAILSILNECNTWKSENDNQLKALLELVSKAHKKDKILIFTQFSDTANYLYNQLRKAGVDKLGCATGQTEHPTDLAHRFSPQSNKREELIGTSGELRVLISTDVLSEGQNLQDSHIILNYDLPWAIIRLIQRAGRVDRIGQKSDKIFCYSFLPEDGIEQIIGLRRRLMQRMRENAEVVGSDEEFIEGEQTGIVQDLYHEKSGILDREDDGEVDLASYAYQIWKNATDKDAGLLKKIPELPHVVYSTKASDEKSGVIVYTRTAQGNDVLTWSDTLGNVITQSQLVILKAAECSPNTKAVVRQEHHHEIVRTAIEYVHEEEKAIGGQLGRKTGVRYKIYHRLKRMHQESRDTLFFSEVLKRAVDQIYQFPLKDFAIESIGRQLKLGVDDQTLSDLITSLYEENKLCLVSDDDGQQKDPQIICSLGLTL